MSTVPALQRTRPASRVFDNAVRMPLLSSRVSALPRFVTGYALAKALDGAAEIAARFSAARSVPETMSDTTPAK